MTNWVMVWKYFKGLTIMTNNYTYKVKVKPGFKSTHLDGLVVKIGLNDPITDRVKV